MVAHLREGWQDNSMDSVRHTAWRACIPVHSAVSTMEVRLWRVRSVDDQALAEGSMGAPAADSTEVEAEGRQPLHLRRTRQTNTYGENTHAQRNQQVGNREGISVQRDSHDWTSNPDGLLHSVVLCSEADTANFSVSRSGESCSFPRRPK